MVHKATKKHVHVPGDRWACGTQIKFSDFGTVNDKYVTCPKCLQEVKHNEKSREDQSAQPTQQA